MKKWMITNLNIHRNYGLNYKGFIEFKIWDEKYHCSEVNKIIKDIILNNRIKYEFYIDNLKWVDFRIHTRYKMWNWYCVYEVEILNNYLNPNKIMSYLEVEV